MYTAYTSSETGSTLQGGVRGGGEGEGDAEEGGEGDRAARGEGKMGSRKRLWYYFSDTQVKPIDE
jgi:hypothetical protein